jgi:hypothetical protein
MDRTVVGRVLMALGAALVVAGLAGFVLGGGDEATSAATVAPPNSTSTSTTTLAPPAAETPEEFLGALLDAFAGGDAATLFARMNPATPDRYGTAECEAYASTVAGMAQDLEFREATVLATWDYVTAGVSTPIADVVEVEVERTINSQTLIQLVRWQLVDGRLTWFTDCGDPA